jgi:hypothetical protein
VSVSSEATVNATDVPCAVVPFHWPTLSDEEDGDVGARLHAEASAAASVPIRNTAFVRTQISTTASGNSISVSDRSHTAGGFRPANAMPLTCGTRESRYHRARGARASGRHCRQVPLLGSTKIL